MNLTQDWLSSFGLHRLLPASLAPWQPLVAEGVLHFLEGLPPARQRAIMAGQLALAPAADPSRRLVALLAQCPTLHKLGQVLARQRHLHPDLRRNLQSLESMPSGMPMAQAAAAIRDELGGEPPVVLGAAPLAEGSVAVVLPFVYSAAGEKRQGVFKLLKPGIEARLAEESAVLAGLAAFLEERGRELGLPALDYRGTLSSVQSLLAKEIRLGIEQDNLRRAAAFYADEPRLLVPAVLPWCTARLTAMERVVGIRVTDAELPRQRRRELAVTMVSALLAKPFWSRAESAMFHADLHGGNLFLAADGRLAVLDWSLAASLAKADRETLVAIAAGGFLLDAPKIRRAVAALGSLEADDPVLADVVDRALDRLVRKGALPGFEWLLALLDDLALRTATGFREDFALFRKTWLSLTGVIADLAGEVSPDLPLLDLGLRRFLVEWPARFLALPDSADFSTHVSNADLLEIGASPWLTGIRYWRRLLRLPGA